MELVFEAAIKDKPKLVALLEADPYGEKSFSRNGYKVKDGTQVSQDREKCYVFMRATEEFASFARSKLKELVDAEGKRVVSESAPEVVAAVAKVIAEEENNAEVGFGSLFG
jgi:hypothetical protein